MGITFVWRHLTREKVFLLQDWIKCQNTIKTNRKLSPWKSYRITCSKKNLRLKPVLKPTGSMKALSPKRSQRNKRLNPRKFKLGKRVMLIGLTLLISMHTKRRLIRRGKRSLSATFFAAIGPSIWFHNRLFSCILSFSEATQDTVTLLPDVWVLYASSYT